MRENGESCPEHNDPLKVYCETCHEVICRDCAISERHNKHDFRLVSNIFPRHLELIEADLQQVKDRRAGMDTAVTNLSQREREIIEQGENIKEEINSHAQKLFDLVQTSRRQLVHQADAVLQHKSQLIARQREQAEKVLYQLRTCEELIKQRLKEWSQKQILTEEERIKSQMKMAVELTETEVFQPMEEADMRFVKNDHTVTGIGHFSSNKGYEKTVLKSSPCLAKAASTASLNIQSHDGSPFSLPPSLISCKLSSPNCDSLPRKCDVNQKHPGEYDISFSPHTREDLLIVQVGGVDIPDSPFTLTVMPLPEMRGKPLRTITGLNEPWGMAVCNNGDIVVTESKSHCVTILSKEGKKVRSFGTQGTQEGQFTHPHGVAVSNDHIFVVDNYRIQQFTLDGDLVKAVGSTESGENQITFKFPSDVAINQTSRNMFVADSHDNSIRVLDEELNHTHNITMCDGIQLNNPNGIAVDREGFLYVVEWGNQCVMKLDSTGNFIKIIGSGHLKKPSSVTIFDDQVFVAECGSHRVSIFNTNGGFLYRFGNGTQLDTPCGIAIDTIGNLYVSDTYNNRIVVF